MKDMYRATSADRTKKIAYISMFAAIIAVCAQISIPLPGGVPITLQTWAVALSGVVLGAKAGAMATVVYILLGAVGIPVFTNLGAGVGIILGPTGGFILSFPLQAFLSGIGTGKKHIAWLLAGLLAGTVVNLSAGMVFFSFVLSTNLQAAFAAAVLPFIPGEIVKIILVAVVGRSINFALAKSGIAV